MKKITPKIKKIIEENPLSLATINKNGMPNVIGVAYVKVPSDNQIVITDNFMSQTRDNILSNKNMCIAVWNSKWEGYKLIGTAEYFYKGKWLRFIKKMPENKDYPAKGAIVVTLSEIIKLG